MELGEALSFVRARNEGVLATIKRDGRPQLSNVLYLLGGGDGGLDQDVVRISVTESRAKTRNLRRDPRGSLYVVGDSFFAYVVLEGTVDLSDVAKARDDEVVEELVSMYRWLRGEEHPNWDEFRDAMVQEGRLVARFRLERAYGMIRV